MGSDTKIEWCHHTFNPWIGCAKVSAGCKNCYAENDNPARISRGRGLELWGVDASRKLKAESGWAEPERWFRAAVKAGERRRVFCASQGDVFEDRRDLDSARDRLWSLIEATAARGCHDIIEGRGAALCDKLCEICGRVRGGIDWLLLTKRPENILRMVPERWRRDGFPPNFWAGASVENQEAADARIPHLLRVPARVRFLSLEPLLGPVDLTDIKERQDGMGHHFSALECDVDPEDDGDFGGRSLDWLIIGGESGPKARPCDVAWIRDLRDQGRDAGVPVFVKQFGAWPLLRDRFDVSEERFKDLDAAGWNEHDGGPSLRHPKGGDMAEWPDDLRVREVPA